MGFRQSPWMLHSDRRYLEAMSPSDGHEPWLPAAALQIISAANGRLAPRADGLMLRFTPEQFEAI